MLAVAFAVLSVSAVFGTGALVYFGLVREKVSATLFGSLLGFCLTTFLAYLLDLLIPAPVISLAVVLAVQTILIFSRYRLVTARWRALPLEPSTLYVLLAAFLITWPSTHKLLFWDTGMLNTGIVNAWGDLGWHISNITAFAAGQTIPPTNPIFAGSPLVYPFLANFFSGLLMAAGADISTSINVPAIVLIPLTITLLYLLALRLTKQRSAAFITILLFLFGGAVFGWLRIFDDYGASPQSFFNFLFHLPQRDYSGVGTDEMGFHFLNPVFTLLLPQRPFLFGMPLSLSILFFLLPDSKIPAPRRFVFAGILAGILPLFHAHSVLALIPPILAIFLLDRKQPWPLFFAPALALGLPAVIYYLNNPSQAGSFFRWAPRWMAGEESLFRYWVKNTGLLIPVALVGIFIKSFPPASRALAAAGFVILLISNIFLFAPWAWDNYKLIVYWFIFSLPLIGLFIVNTYRRLNFLAGRALVIALVIAHILSGALDLWKISLPTAAAWTEWGRDDIVAADMVRRHTLPGDTIATAPIHNSPAALAGRLLYLGYPGHVWSHGYNYVPREAALHTLYTQGLDLLPEHQPQYVLVGPVEKRQFPALHIQPSWTLVSHSSSYALYKLPATN